MFINIPIIGSLFRYEDDLREKSELIIFIRPMVIHHASLNGDLSEFKRYMPELLRPPASSDQRAHQSTPPDPAHSVAH